jgi:hypothetical protein
LIDTEWDLRSDNLRHTRGVGSFGAFGILKKVERAETFVLVLDASTIQQDLRWLARHVDPQTRRALRTAILETMDAGVVVGLVPPVAIVEIERYLLQVATDTGKEVAFVSQLWEAYKRRLVVFTPSRAHQDPALAARDPNDLPFAAVLDEAAGDALLTADRDLLDTISGAATAREIMSLIRAYARHKAVAVGSSGRLMVGALAIGHSGSLLVRGAVGALHAFRRLPPWAQIALAIGGVVLAQRPETKTWLEARLKDLASLAETLAPKLEHTVSRLRTAEDAAESARTAVRHRLQPRTTKRISLRAALLRAMAAREGGTTTAALAALVIESGYTTRARDFVAYLETYLRRDSMFEPTAAGWRLRYGSRT